MERYVCASANCASCRAELTLFASAIRNAVCGALDKMSKVRHAVSPAFSGIKSKLYVNTGYNLPSYQISSKSNGFG